MKSIKIQNYTGDLNALISAPIDSNGSQASRIAHYAQQIYLQSNGEQDLVVDGIGVGSLLSETRALLAAQGVNAFTGATLTAVNNTIKALKDAGLWSTQKFAGIYFMANPTNPSNSIATRYNAINPTDPTVGILDNVNGVTFDTVAGQGWTGGHSKYLDTKISTLTTVHTKGSCHASVYIRTEPTAGNFSVAIGYLESTTAGIVNCFVYPKSSVGYVGIEVNDATLSHVFIPENYTGYFAYNRSGKTRSAIKDTRASSSSAVAALDPVNTTIKICGGKNASNYFCNGQICFATVGAGLSVTPTTGDHALLNAIVVANWITPLGLLPEGK